MGSYILASCFAFFIPLIGSVVRRFRVPETISTPAWLISTNALFILGGPVLSWLTAGQDSTSSTRGAATVAYVLVAYSLTLALSYVTVARSVGSLFGQPIQSAVGTIKLVAGCATHAEVLVWATLVIIIQGYSLVFHSLGLSGGNLAFDHRLHVPYLTLSLYMLFGTTAIGLCAVLTKIALGDSSTAVRLACLALLFAEFLITLNNGRRELIWLTMSVTFGIVWSGRSRWALALPFVIGTTYLIIALFAPIFLRARNIYTGGSAPSVTEAYRVAISEQADDVTGERTIEAERNTSWRFRTYSFWEQMYEEAGPGFTSGRILMQATLMVLPRMLFGFSKFTLGLVDEELLNVSYDISNNVSLESYLDLGLFGPAIYGMIFGALFAVSDSLITFAALRHRMLAVLGGGIIMRVLFGPEENPIGYFSVLRTVVIFALLAVLLAAVFGRKSVNEGSLSPMERAGSGQPPEGAALPKLALRFGGARTPSRLLSR